MGRQFGASSRPAIAILTGTSLIAALAATLGAGLPGQGQLGHSQPDVDPPAITGPQEAPDTTVTLITGDTVHLHGVPGGRQAATVDPAPRPNGVVPQFHVTTRDGTTHVVPSDVQALIPDRLDPALFNVTSLVEQGLDDASRPTLPLILDYPDDQPRTLSNEPVPGTTTRLALDSIGALAVEGDRSDAALGQAVTRLAAASTGATVQRFGAVDAGPLAAVEKIWLDATVAATLDRSTGQISAPAAWAAGYDGSGVTVAVLDTGVDESHQDLAEQVAAAENFTWDEDATDGDGHGTHVASTIAGTGAASGGDRQGVAPGARLLSGKVLDSEGGGQVSWVIAGMEWAAAEQDADIVNMSLGLFPGSFEAPPLTAAVERLSTDHGTLFVVAAGNLGCAACIGSPADAPSALTVGAVDRADQLAEFSSRGPVFGGHDLKPDITAPGVGIAAARAAGTGDTDDPYLALSGTSMASPHVAGAAALLAQARPELTGPELKGALMSTAVATTGLDVFEQGAGRVDVGQVLASPVLASNGTLDFGFIPFPDGEVDPLQHTIGYRNVTDAPVTVRLRLEGLPDGDARVDPAQLTVAPGATASARVTVDVAGGTPGRFPGQLVAEATDAVPLRTPIGYFVEEEHFELTLRAIARDGRPARPMAGPFGSPVIDVETGEQIGERCQTPPAELDPCLRVTAGTYSAMAFVRTKPAWASGDGDIFTETPLHTALVGDPEITVTEDTTLVMDARDAVEVQVDTPDHDAQANVGGAADLTWSRTPVNGPATTDHIFNGPGAQLEERLFMQPIDEVAVGSFNATSRWRLEAPAITMAVDGIELHPSYYRADWFSDNSWQFPMLDGDATLPVVAAGEGRPDEIAAADVDGALALIRRSDDVSVGEQSNRAAAAGARLVAIYNDQPGSNSWAGPPTKLEVPTVRLSHEEGTRLVELVGSRPVTVTATGTPASPFLYDLVYAERGQIPDDLHYVAATDDLAAVARDFYTQLDGTLSEVSWPFLPGSEFATGHLYPMTAPSTTRIDYHVPDPDIEWEYGVSTPQEPYNGLFPRPFVRPLRLASARESYPEPGTHQQSWFRQPLRPGFAADRPVTRDGDILTIPTAGLVDDGGHLGEAWSLEFGGGYDALFQVWRGDELLGEATTLPSGTIALPPEQDTYRITYSIDNNTPWANLSTRTSTDWTFTSTHTEAAVPVPLLELDYDLGVDLTNRALRPADRRGPNEVDITVSRPGGVTIAAAGLTVEISYDDGETWREVRVRRSGTHTYSAHLPARGPRDGTGFLSLRVAADDADGNRIDQEIIRAAALSRP